MGNEPEYLWRWHEPRPGVQENLPRASPALARLLGHQLDVIAHKGKATLSVSPLEGEKRRT